MKIFVDAKIHCHTSDVPGARAVETNLFDGKCSEFIEGYCYDDRNGYITVYPWKPYAELAAAQAQYEHEQYAAVTAERDALLEYIENEEFTTDELGNRYRKEVGADGGIHLVLIESFTGELFQ